MGPNLQEKVVSVPRECLLGGGDLEGRSGSFSSFRATTTKLFCEEKGAPAEKILATPTMRL